MAQEVRVYVDDLDKEKEYWTDKLGFQLITERNDRFGREYVLKHSGSQLTFIMIGKEAVKKADPELDTDMPSIVLTTDDIYLIYNTMKDRGVTVGDMFDLGSFKSFNFADPENNYIAVWQA